MKLPKFLRKDMDAETHQRTVFQNTKRIAQAESLSRGRHILPIACTDSFSKKEKASLPENMIPWVRVESTGRVYLFTYAHFEMEGEDFMKVVRKKTDVPGLILCIYTGEGEPWPTKESQIMVEVNVSPDDITGTQLGADILNRMILHFSGCDSSQTIEKVTA